MRIYIRSDLPITLQKLAKPWHAMFGKHRPGKREQELAEQLAQQAEAFADAVEPAFWQEEISALQELAACANHRDIDLLLAPLVLPDNLPVQLLPLLEGWSARELAGCDQPVSPLALFWLKQRKARTYSPFHGSVRRAEAVDGIAVLELEEEAADRVREQREHAEEHIDEGMYLLQANLDDASPEWIAYAMERLFQAGANDVSIVPLTMKKSRQGAMLQVLCYQSELEAVKTVLFAESTTFGLRYFPVACHRLARRFVTVRTSWGEVTVKVGYHRGKRVQIAPEYSECARLAQAASVPLREVYRHASELAGELAPLRLHRQEETGRT
jgi:hypothetical protein